MRYIVEWGIPALDAPPAGRFASFQCANAAQAIELARQLSWTHTGQTAELRDVRRSNCPRVEWWNSARNFWIVVSKLDGVARGPAYGWIERDTSVPVAR